MSQRLNIDSSVVGYWGFDEALETDAAIDYTANGLNLTVTSASGTAPGVVGNSRQFNGSSSYASVTDGLLRITGKLTLIAWVKLLSYNGTGTQQRAIVSCAGPTSSDGSLYALSVTLQGAVRYSHTSASGEVVVQTNDNVIRTGQFYCVQVRRWANGSKQQVEIYVDNVLKPISVITVGGVPDTMPVPTPASNSSAIFSVGRSLREANSAFWDGFIDEVSVHSEARPYQAYLIDAYYRGALRAGTTKLTATGTVVAVSSYEMGAGVRWWCVERDRDLYVVRESPFGNFGSEVRLTTVGGGNSSAASKPELVYDPSTDTLYVFFVAGNRVYKLTASSTDDPATINMPFTADTGSIIKSVDNVEAGRLGDGGGQRDPLPSDYTYVNKTPIKVNLVDVTYNISDGGGQGSVKNFSSFAQVPQVAFIQLPSPYGFGVVIGPVNSQIGGYAAYEVTGNESVALPLPVKLYDNSRYFFPITPRSYGRSFVVETLGSKGNKTGIFSEVLVDRFYEPGQTPDGVRVQVGLYGGDGSDSTNIGDGGGQRPVRPEEYSYVNRTPLKMSLQDPTISNLSDGGGQQASVTQASKTVML